MRSGLKSDIFEKFAALAGSISNSEVEGWKQQGGKVIGYTCSFVPEELFVAAGLMPFRIRATGSLSAGRADDYFEAANICSLVRHCFNKILTGEYEFIDGCVIGGGCDANRHILDNWEKSEARIPFLHRIFFPHSSGILMAQNFRNQLENLKQLLEEHFGLKITDDKLRDAIVLCNEIRDLQKAIYALRKVDNPPITASETIALVVAGYSMPKEAYKADLTQLLEELRGVTVPENKKTVRLMVVGPGHDEPTLCDIIETMGGTVVTDLTCYGGKTLFGSVREADPDPLQALADYQVIDRPLCPKNLDAHPLINREIMAKIKEYRVDGLIGQGYLCCETWGGELFVLQKELKEAGIPMLRIEREYTSDSLGQVQTRVQAFIETISGGLL